MQTNTMVFKSVLAALMLTCCVAGIEAQGNAVAVASEQDLKITSQTDDYVIQKQRQYAAHVVSMNEELANYKKNYDNQLLTMETQKALLVANIKEAEERLQPLELLNDLSKYCVQTHYPKITKVLTVASVSAAITTCVTTAQNLFNGFTLAAQTTSFYLDQYYIANLAQALAECKKTHDNAQLNYTTCVTKAITDAESTTSVYLKQFKTQMETVTCTGDGHVKQAVDCSYNIVYVALSTIAEVRRLIEDCVQGKEFCPPCQSIPPPRPAPECPKEIFLTLTEAELQNATISNPFIGVNTDCVKVKFEDPNLQ